MLKRLKTELEDLFCKGIKARTPMFPIDRDLRHRDRPRWIGTRSTKGISVNSEQLPVKGGYFFDGIGGGVANE